MKALLPSSPPPVHPSNLRRLREERCLSQHELADMVGLSNAAIYLYETGRMKMSPRRRAQLAEALGVSMNVLAGTEPMPPARKPRGGKKWPRGRPGRRVYPPAAGRADSV
jgi:transcriptional regulator with XRE-family HTH domain